MANRNVKYDTLLKPVQDNLLKDWGLSLSIFLDDFMDHLDKTAKMNFSEAAMVVQNGTAFYCKRVDVVYKSIHEFVTDICSSVNDDVDSAGTHKNSEGKKRKKNVKSLEVDDLLILDFVASDHAIDAKVNSLVFQGSAKQIVLCTSMKALRKAGTSVTVYQAFTRTLGCKDEFRVFGKTYVDGTVNEDFNVDHNIINPVDEIDDGIADDSYGGFDDPMVGQNDDPPEVPMNKISPPEPEIPPSPEIPGFSTLAVSATIPVAQERCAPARPKRKKNFEWEPIPSDFKLIIKPLKLGKSLKVPNECLDEETLKDLEEMKVKSRKRKRGKAEPDKDEVDGFRIRWIDEAIKVGSFDLTVMNITKEKIKRKQVLAAKPKPNNIVDHEDSISHFDDPAQDDFEAFQDDAELTSAAPVNRFDAMIQEEDRHEYADEALKAIEKFKETRRENASRQTDIAKRVAKWHEAIMPKLAEAEARSHLDVHEYGTRILNMFPDDNQEFVLKFHDIVKDEPANEICRYLLATLMLANTYNVKIIKRCVPLINTLGMYCDYVELRLITKTRHHEEMDEAFRVTSGECGS